MGKNRCNHCAPNRASGARLSLGEPPRVDRAELQTAAGNSAGRRLHLTLPAAAGPDRSPYGAGLYGIMGIRSSGTGSHRPGNGHEGLRPLPNLQNTGAQLLLCACTAFPSLPLGVLCVEHRLGAGSESCQPLELTGNDDLGGLAVRHTAWLPEPSASPPGHWGRRHSAASGSPPGRSAPA